MEKDKTFHAVSSVYTLPYGGNIQPFDPQTLPPTPHAILGIISPSNIDILVPPKILDKTEFHSDDLNKKIKYKYCNIR